MAASNQKVVYRCGICSTLFVSSTDCYAHMLLHETPEEATPQNEGVEGEVLQEQSAGEQQADDESVPDSVRQTRPQSSETDVTAAELQVLRDCGLSVVQENQTSETAVIQEDESSVSKESADLIQIVEASTEQETQPSTKPAEEVLATSAASIKIFAESDQVTKLDRNTNEELDIADILINIKQEKVDVEQVLSQDRDSKKDSSNVIHLKGLEKPQDAEPVGTISVSLVPDSPGKLTTEYVSNGDSETAAASDQKKKKKKKVGKKKEKSEKSGRAVEGDVKVVRRLRKGEDADAVIDIDNTHACKTCGKRYAILKSLKYHERTHNLDKLFYCKVCEKGFVKPSELTNHLKIHESEGNSKKRDGSEHQCQYCDKSYKILKSLKHHEKVHEVGFRFKCNLCKKAFFKPSDLDRHKIRHKPLSRCYLCGKQFRDPKKLERHVRKHPEVLMEGKGAASRTSKLTCKICSKKCGNFSQLCNHVRTHTKRRPFACDICGKCFGRVSNMKIHRKLHSGIRSHLCDICGASFADWTNRNRHMKKHEEASKPVHYVPRTPKVQIVEELPPPPKVKQDKEHLVSELLESYQEFCFDPAGKVAKVNPTTNSSEVGIQAAPLPDKKNPAQVYVVFEDNPSICYILEYENQDGSVSSVLDAVQQEGATLGEAVEGLGEIISEGAVAEEVSAIIADGSGPDVTVTVTEDVKAEEEEEDAEESQEEEEEKEEEVEDVKPQLSFLQRSIRRKFAEREKKFRCDVCGARFKYKISLKFHYKKHTKEGVMYCSVCNAEYYRKSRLNVHMRSHTGERPFKCGICETSFAVAYELTIHMRKHTGQGRRECEHCDKVFYTQRALNAHMRNLINDKPFSCSDCGKLFKRMDQLRRHKLCHSGFTPFKCHRCNKAFRDSSNRKRHIIKTHGRQALSSLPKRRISLIKSKDFTETATILAQLSEGTQTD